MPLRRALRVLVHGLLVVAVLSWLTVVAGAVAAVAAGLAGLVVAGLLWPGAADPDPRLDAGPELGPGHVAASPEPPPVPGLTPVRSLSTQALGREWVRSAAALDAALEPATRQHVADRRRALLDEMERRNPESVAGWLADGAPEGVDPSSYPPQPPDPAPGEGRPDRPIVT
ncbi:hypothetical protein GB931_09755 [Modestobacter sp. I12A-02628]|uniref:Uncharacterized protein n=1 Tax=Goekera deserti TaxID=2497753 RepID=A0A7K3WLB8_9ACTN|nr:hypothetical protein [Goekera deserti]MPQ98199.1 hypothetical protein [Goekera deserti]NDI48849.1 hypothetical protein [Goekera deserti]NEL56530.1 hypothetical protein [Goekera deserti]